MSTTSATKGKSLIVGAGGQVGSQMMRFLEDRFGPGHALPTGRRPATGYLSLNLAELDSHVTAARLLEPHTLGAIYCFAGMTNVDACEETPDEAYRANARGPEALAGYAHRARIPFVYFSTEYLFDGAEEAPGPYAEQDLPNPLNVYGRSKLEGENAVLAAHPDALIVRTTVVYGPDPGQKNYLHALLRNLSAGVVMRVPEDQISTPTYNRDLILATFGLVEAKATGIFHICGPERLGRLEFARRVASQLGLNAGLLRGVPTSELGQRARRPLAAGLSTKKLTTLHPLLRMRFLAEALREAAPELNVAQTTTPASAVDGGKA